IIWRSYMSFFSSCFGGHSRVGVAPVARDVMVYKYVKSSGSGNTPLIRELRKYLNINISSRGFSPQTTTDEIIHSELKHHRYPPQGHKLWSLLNLLPNEIKKTYGFNASVSDKRALFFDLIRAVVMCDVDLVKSISPGTIHEYKLAREMLDGIIREAHPSNSDLQQAIAEAFGVIDNPEALIKKIKFIDQKYNRSCSRQLPAPIITNVEFNSKMTGVKSQIQGLLDIKTNAFFCNIITPASIGKGKQHTVNVIGDLDGSVTRMVLSAMFSGYINITKTGVKLLASLMRREATLANTTSSEEVFFQAYQSDDNISRQLEELVTELSYSDSIQKLVYIGDTAFDRFACNQKVSLEIREKLHEKGVVFILGNHDVHPVGQESYQWGYYSVKTITRRRWAEHQSKVFKKAHYDENHNIIFVHNGFQLGSGMKIHTAFGLVNFKDGETPADFCERVNKLEPDWDNIDSQCLLTNFRPNKHDIQSAANRLKATIVHGHNDKPSVDKSLNAYKVHEINSGRDNLEPFAIQLLS
ncbi:DUF4049 domain-containing protein, partial [Citrobacter portucalensis]|uniref:DUF4049 domain-containing protein n=1 Tax=Citrobacter portucalensis TaxID=1639133 RepID=UPI00226B58FC